MKQYTAIGLMSGSSLDGVDLAYCRFIEVDKKWQFDILSSDCIAYPVSMIDRLRKAPSMSGLELYQLDVDLGHFLGEIIQYFRQKNKIDTLDFVVSHGHTIFHFPSNKLTTQIGDGAAIASHTQTKVITQFRNLDVALGGQGAPIVPIGEHYLFSDFNCFLNLGGIANISFHQGKKIIGFDVCAANQVLNYLANKLDLPYDKNGDIAKSGKIDTALLNSLNKLIFFSQAPPKSLDNGFSKNEILPLLDTSNTSIADLLATVSEHIASQIAEAIKSFSITPLQHIYATGGGAYNLDLIQRIEAKTSLKVVIPNNHIVEYKEALIIAFMGVLRLCEIPNVWCSASGASRDSINGTIYQG